MASLQKNVSGQNMTFALVNATTGAALVGATVNVFVTKDGAAQASGGGAAPASQGNGQYNYAPTQSETNATDVGFLFTATNAIPVNMDFHTDLTDANSFIKVDVEDWKGTAVASPATAGIPDINVKNIVNAAAAIDVNNLLKVDVEDINGIALAAQALAQSTQSICWGTCSGGSVTTAIVGTLHNPSSLTATGQFIGRTIIFLGNTATGGMQAQASNITASTTGATPTITFTAMTTAPANGDVFVIL